METRSLNVDLWTSIFVPSSTGSTPSSFVEVHLFAEINYDRERNSLHLPSTASICVVFFTREWYDITFRTWRTVAEETAPRFLRHSKIRAQHSHQRNDRPVKPPLHHLIPTEAQQRSIEQRATSSPWENKTNSGRGAPPAEVLGRDKQDLNNGRGEHSWEGRRTINPTNKQFIRYRMRSDDQDEDSSA